MKIYRGLNSSSFYPCIVAFIMSILTSRSKVRDDKFKSDHIIRLYKQKRRFMNAQLANKKEIYPNQDRAPLLMKKSFGQHRNKEFHQKPKKINPVVLDNVLKSFRPGHQEFVQWRGLILIINGGNGWQIFLRLKNDPGQIKKHIRMK